MRTRRGGQLSPLHFDPEIERTVRIIRARRRSNIMSFGNVSSSEATGMSFIPPVSEFHFGSTSASGGAVSAPAPIPSCTPPSIPPFTSVSQPQSTNPFTSAMSWVVPTCEGTPATRQQTSTSQPFSQPQSSLFKQQPNSQPFTQSQQYQPPPQQYHYSEAEERYDEEEEGWVPPQQPWNRGRGPPRRTQQHQHPRGQQGYNDHHTYGNPAQPLHFAQPRRQSVASHFQPREYDDSSPIYIPDNIDSQDKAKYWFTSLPSNSITTWNQLKAKFLQEFYPASKTTEIRRIIQDFQQNPGEAFHEAFDRLKELLRSCPHHEVRRWQLVKLFFEGVSETHQAMINASSSGTFMWQDPEEACQFLEQLSNGSKANFSTRKTVGTAATVGVNADWKKEVKKEISELNKKFDRLMSTLQNAPQGLSQGGQRGPKTQEANQVYGQGQGQYNNGQPYRPYNQGQQQNFNNQRQNQSTNQPRTYQPANNNNNGHNNRGPNNAANNAPGTQEDMVAKMYEMFSATQQQSQANAKAIANMER
ncbi:hypothetical protein L1887_06997 [Cichorium endivia]|nr:hypothetical protein L1887_06997 [Cichorium endivia]